MKTGILIQARMGSTRLPGKVMMPLPPKRADGKPPLKALEWTVEACLRTGFEVYIATSTNPEDDAIYDYFQGSGYTSVGLFRGSPDDVLDRLYQCARLYQLDVVVRVTGDCPFVDPEVIKQVVQLRKHTGSDYASNVDPPTWPDGLDVQVVTFDALQRAHQEATEPTDRDTVLAYIVRHRNSFFVNNLPCPIRGLVIHRWVIDTAQDYELCSEIAQSLLAQGRGPGASFADILDMAPPPADAELLGRNERYLAARAGELKVSDNFPGSSTIGIQARARQPYGASTYSKSYVAWGHDSPLYLTHAQGSRVFDVDGNEFIDMTAGLGTTVLGHSDPYVRRAIERQLDLGIGFPLAHENEHRIARNIMRRAMSTMGISTERKIVFGKNGSDVTSAAVRLARVVTGRKMVTKLAGGYHGWHDWTLHGTMRGDGTDASKTYYGNPADIATDGVLRNSAALILEPDMVPAESLREIIESCRKYGVLVIFDEMVTAFRYPQCTVAATYDLDPDMLCLGKALGNGMPITALIGRAEMMDKFVTIGLPTKPYAFYSGTHFGEMLSLAAAAAVVNRMGQQEQNHLAALQLYLNTKVTKIIDTLTTGGVIWTQGPIPKLSLYDPDIAAMFRREMAHNGVLFYTALLPTLMHTMPELDHVVDAMDAAFNAIKSGKARGKAIGNERIMRS
jgi:glutamate-1-semialdehyde aminotransferase/spore coat polysaccharide biosynthesis protein SpsF (cytidylyltransferase family)